MKKKFIELNEREASEFEKLELVYQIRYLIQVFHDEKLPEMKREYVFNKINALTKRLTH